MRTPALGLVVLGALTVACGGAGDAGLFDETATDSSISAGGSSADGGSGVGPSSDADTTNDTTSTTGSEGGASTRGSTVSDSTNTTGRGASGGGGSGGSGAGMESTTASGGTGATTSTGATTGTDATGGTGATGGQPGTGGASTTGVAGTSSIPVDGSITFQEVCEMTPCGGELEEDYDYVGACMEESVLSGSFESCPDVELVQASGSIEGQVSFGGGDLEQDVTLTMEAEYFVPAHCVPQNCNLLAVAVVAAGYEGTSCQNGAEGGCDCTVPLTTSADASTSYDTDGDTLTLGASAVSYCASGGTLEYTNGVGDYEYVLRAEAN